MTRLFDELESFPDPGPPFMIFGPHIPEIVKCGNCRQRVDTPTWHLNPETLEYECETA